MCQYIFGCCVGQVACSEMCCAESALKVELGWSGGAVVQLITLSTPTRVEVELG